MPEFKEAMEAITQLRERLEKVGKDSPEFKELQGKVEKALETFDAENQKTVTALEAERKAREETADRVEALEKELLRATRSGKSGSYKETPEYKALNALAKGGLGGLKAEEKALLRTDSSTDGGYLTMPEMDTEIIKKITEISPVRAVARVKTVGNKTLEIPTRQTIPTASYEGEGASGDDSASSYGNETLTCFRLTTTVPFTRDLLMDSAFDLESEILGDVAEAFAYREGRAFVLGTGSKQPEGFLVNPQVIATPRVTAASGVIGGDDLILLTGDLKTGYAPMYSFNRRTLATLRTIKTTDGMYIWQPGLAAGVPNTLNGERYVVMNDMPDIAANALAVVYGDFLRGYRIIDRTGMTMIRDEYAKKRQNIIEVTFHRYNHGQVVLPEAFKALKVKA